MSTSTSSAGSAPRVPGTGSPAAATPKSGAGPTGRLNARGWERVHVCVDDATRMAYVEVLPDEEGHHRDRLPASGHRLLYRSHGITVERLMTDNGIRLHLDRARARLPLTRDLPHPHPAANARRPTARRRDSSARCCGSGPTPPSTAARPRAQAALGGWLERYNLRRRHGALGHRPPIQRLRELQGNNVAGIYT